MNSVRAQVRISIPYGPKALAPLYKWLEANREMPRSCKEGALGTVSFRFLVRKCGTPSCKNPVIHSMRVETLAMASQANLSRGATNRKATIIHDSCVQGDGGTKLLT